MIDNGKQSIVSACPSSASATSPLGGTGKTPCVEYVCRTLSDAGYRVAIVSRGYGVDAGPNDEALVLEECLPDVPHLQGRDRVAVANLAIEELECDVIVLDDGFQHRRLHRDLDIVLVDSSMPLLKDHIFPRGTMRESVTSLKRADVIIQTRWEQRADIALQPEQFPKPLSVKASHRPTELIDSDGNVHNFEMLNDRPVAIFSGIGHPQGFKYTVRSIIPESMPLLPARILSFPDHHNYTRDDVAMLRTLGREVSHRHSDLDNTQRPRETATPRTCGLDTLCGADSLCDCRERVGVSRTIVERHERRGPCPMMSNVVFLPNWIGDLVMATPAIRALREHWPSRRLIGVCKPYVAETLAGSDWFDELILFDAKGTRDQRFFKVLWKLQRETIDVAALFPNSFRVALLAQLAGCRRIVGFARYFRDSLLTHRLYPKRGSHGKLKPTPIIDDYNAIVERIGVPKPGHRLELFTTPHDEALADAVWTRLKLHRYAHVVGLNPGGAFGSSKHWPVEHFIELARDLVRDGSTGVVVLCGPSERATAHKIASRANHAAVTALADTPLSIGLTKAMVRRLDLLVTTDSGPRHFAAAFNRPVVSLFGPTHQEWTDTYFAQEIRLQLDVPCGPCQQRICPEGHHKCMTELTPRMVLAAARQRFSPLSPGGEGPGERGLLSPLSPGGEGPGERGKEPRDLATTEEVCIGFPPHPNPLPQGRGSLNKSLMDIHDREQRHAG